MKVYITDFDSLSDATQRSFEIAKNAAENDGHTVVNSFGVLAGQRERLSELLAADTLVTLPGWQEDPSGNSLVRFASELGIPVKIANDGHLVPRVSIVGMSGYARSGKDTIGAFLADYGYVRASFADYIREALYTLNPYASDGHTIQDIIDEHGWEGSKTTHPEIREQLQRLGSEVGRELIDKNVWVDLTFRNLPDGAKVVVTDCRFPNEAGTVTRLGGKMWRVERPGFGAANAHPSETALDNWQFDHVFHNDGNVDDLRQAVELVIEQENL